MVGSIDPRCETLRGTHWPKKGRVVVWNSRRGTPSWPAVQNDRINRPDIWMQAIRSDRQKNLRHEGRPHMGPGVRRDDDGAQSCILEKSATANVMSQRPSWPGLTRPSTSYTNGPNH